MDHSAVPFRLMLDMCPEMLLLLAPGGDVLYANQVACRALGVSEARLDGLNASDLFVKPLRIGAESEANFLRATDSSFIPIRIQACSLMAGDVDATLVLARRVEPTSRIGADVYRRIVEAGRDAIAVYDQEGRIQIWNKAATSLFGWSAREALGEDVSTIVHLVPRESSAHGIANSILRHAPWEGECVVTDRGGRSFFAHVTDMPVADEAGSADCTIIIAHDLTERQQAEEALRRSESHFQQAQKMETIGRLTGTIMHDINNQLAVISGYCSLVLEEQGHDSPMRDSILEISAAAHRATTLARQLLAYSRNQLPERRLLDLATLLTEQKEMLERVLGSDVNVVIAPATERCTIMADPVGLEQVIMNLAVNARDAMPRGGTLTLTTLPVTIGESSDIRSLPPGDYVSLVISDTGEGMDEATRAKAFEPFFTTKEKGKGTGLGLFSVQGIVRQHNGHIRLQSVRGKGTTFTIFLPRTDP